MAMSKTCECKQFFSRKQLTCTSSRARDSFAFYNVFVNFFFSFFGSFLFIRFLLLRLPNSRPPHRIWKPDVLMYNSADEGFDGTYPTNVVVRNNGSCVYIPPGQYKKATWSYHFLFPQTHFYWWHFCYWAVIVLCAVKEEDKKIYIDT